MILTITMNPAIDKVYSVSDFAVGHVFRPDNMTFTAGGKGLNVARVASILGEKVSATGLAGGSAGIFIDKEVRAQGIGSEFVHIEGETRTCIAIMDKKNNTSTEILEKGPVISEKECKEFLEKYRALLDGVSIVTASGSLPAGLPDDFYVELIKEAKNKNKIFILDTSGKYLEKGISGKPFMIKPNQEEIEKVIGRELVTMEDIADALMDFKDSGIEIPCMTLGKDGAAVALDDGVYHFYAPPIEVLNTVGSGDSFVAGCAAGFHRGYEKKEVIKLGMACGMANTQFLKTGMISIELVEKFSAMINCEKIK